MAEGGAARVLVLCIGNSLVADDAVGCVVHERLTAEALPADVKTELLGLGGMALVDCLGGEGTLILVDAVQLGAPPGTVHVMDWAEIPTARGQAVSLHGIGPREALDVCGVLYPERMPRRIKLIGVEGERFDALTEEMTPAVLAAVPGAVRAVRAEIDAAP